MYLIWVDILGFDILASKISEETHIEKRKVRMDFITTIKNKISDLKNDGYILGERYGQSDDWLIASSSLNETYHIIEEILNHNTGYQDYPHIPLEIGIGYSTFNDYTKLDGVELSVETETIEFLKSYIINEYRNWYKNVNNASIKESFIVITKDGYNNMNLFDKSHCTKIESSLKEFYQIDISFVKNKSNFGKFLKILNIDKESLFDALNEVYVKPNEFSSIIKLLEDENVVFIVGDPEIGKTFTALYILWIYYLEGYTPVWIRGHDFYNRNEIRKMMSEGSINGPKHVIYLEDPFGKTIYEDTDAIRREIGTFINIIKNSDVKVIFTSRLNIFNQFINAKISEEELRNISIDMLLMNPSYNYDSLEKMLLNWSQYFESKWLINLDLKNKVVETALKSLKTPLSIRDFTIEASNIDSLDKITSIINKKSKEIKASFAEEIKNMHYEKILFLSLNYIFFSLDDEEIHNIYNQVCIEYNLNHIKYSYNNILLEFKYKFQTSESRKEFSHPSYEEGLVESWNDLEIFNFIIAIMNSLIWHPNPFVRGLIGFTLTKNYNVISNKEIIEPIIFTVITDKKAVSRMGVASAARYYHKELPMPFKIKMVNKMIKDRHREIRAEALRMIGADFDLLPYDLTIDIINKGLDDKAAYTRQTAVDVVRAHLKSLPKNMGVRALECNKKLTEYSGWLISYFAMILQSALEEEVMKYLSE